MRYLIVSFFLYLFSASFSLAATAETEDGSHTVTAAEYRFPASIDNDVLTDTPTEIWAKLFYPSDITQINSKLPLVIFLHGNHATCGKGSNPRVDISCTYTETGTCPIGYVVTPNHTGYDYIAKHLASWGMLVVSINANRGITCGSGREDDYGLNLARGKLILRHLSLLYSWATNGGLPSSIGLGSNGLVEKIDFGAVGLMGHSRGGEGVRAAYNLYHDKHSIWPAQIPGLQIKAIFEIGAVDGQTPRILDANGTVWNQLLPLCDHDVSTLEGRYPFERMLQNKYESADSQKSLYEVWGANHNFFNTQWQESDAEYCDVGTPLFDPAAIGSEQQQKIALVSVAAFFRSHLQPDQFSKENKLFNPLINLPASVLNMTPIDRDFTTSPGSAEVLHLQDFESTDDQKNKIKLSQLELTYLQLTERMPFKVGEITWQHADNHTYLETVLSESANGINLSSYATLDLRIARTDSTINDAESTDFSITLEDIHGHTSSPVRIKNYLYLNRSGTHIPLLRALRIPLAAFNGVTLSKIKRIRFTFNQTDQGQLLISHLSAHHHFGKGIDLAATATCDQITCSRRKSSINPNELHNEISHIIPTNLNKIVSVAPLPKPTSSYHQKASFEITLASEVAFPVTDSLPELKIGNQTFKLSHYSNLATLKELTFTIPTDQYKQLKYNSLVYIKVGSYVWSFGQLKK